MIDSKYLESSIDELPRPIQFAILGQNEINVTNDAMEILGSLPSDQKVAVVTFVGPIDSGKSYLATKLIG